MSVVARFSIPTDQFELGRTLAAGRDARARFGSVVPTEQTVVPYVWVANADADAVGAALGASSLVEAAREIHRVDGETLFYVDWTPNAAGVIETIRNARAVLLEATGNGERWSFRLLFSEESELSEFYRTCVDDGYTLDLERVQNTASPSGDRTGLTDEQRETLLTALEEGYFAVPRRVTLVELSEMLGISDSAVSQRVRRGLTTLISSALRSDHAGGPTDGDAD